MFDKSKSIVIASLITGFVVKSIKRVVRCYRSDV